MKIGYARVSSSGQSLELQLETLEAAGCAKIYEEKESGSTTTRRHALERALDQLRDGDELVVTKLDRLARSLQDLLRILERVTAAGATFTCLQQSAVDVSTASGRLMLSILGAIAEFERELIRERQADGIAKAKEKGVYRGKARKLDPVKVMAAYKEHGDKAHKVLGCARSTVYRIVGEQALAEAPAGAV